VSRRNAITPGKLPSPSGTWESAALPEWVGPDIDTKSGATHHTVDGASSAADAEARAAGTDAYGSPTAAA
jgi:hypothetical protein